MKENIMSKEAFNELIDGLEYVESLTEYGRKNIKYHVQKLQQENKILKENAENNDKVVDKVNWENMLLKKENKQLNGAIQTYDILLKSNIEENQQLKIQISAREMFEYLGYEYYEDDGFNCYKKEKRKLIEPDYISFNRLEREVFMTNDSKNSNGVIVDMKLLQAINQQINELGWK